MYLYCTIYSSGSLHRVETCTWSYDFMNDNFNDNTWLDFACWAKTVAVLLLPSEDSAEELTFPGWWGPSPTQCTFSHWVSFCASTFTRFRKAFSFSALLGLRSENLQLNWSVMTHHKALHFSAVVVSFLCNKKKKKTLKDIVVICRSIHPVAYFCFWAILNLLLIATLNSCSVWSTSLS